MTERRTFDAAEWAHASGGASLVFARSLAIAAEAVIAATRAGALVVDAGCGPGVLTRALADAGRRVVGVDHDPAMLAAARAGRDRAAPSRARGTGSSDLARADLRSLPLRDACADAVAAVSVLGTLADPAPFLAEARRVLRTGGRLFITITNRGSLLLRLQHGLVNRGAVPRPAGRASGIRAYTAAEATARLADAGFRVEAVAHYNFVLEIGNRVCPGRAIRARLDRTAGARGGTWARNVLITARAG